MREERNYWVKRGYGKFCNLPIVAIDFWVRSYENLTIRGPPTQLILSANHFFLRKVKYG